MHGSKWFSSVDVEALSTAVEWREKVPIISLRNDRADLPSLVDLSEVTES